MDLHWILNSSEEGDQAELQELGEVLEEKGDGIIQGTPERRMGEMIKK